MQIISEKDSYLIENNVRKKCVASDFRWELCWTSNTDQKKRFHSSFHTRPFWVCNLSLYPNLLLLLLSGLDIIIACFPIQSNTKIVAPIQNRPRNAHLGNERRISSNRDRKYSTVNVELHCDFELLIPHFFSFLHFPIRTPHTQKKFCRHFPIFL